MKVKLITPVYNCISFFINSNILFIGGGHNPQKGDIDTCVSINLTSGDVFPLEDLPVKSSSIMPGFFYYNCMNFFKIDKSVTNIPHHIAYYLDLPGLLLE